MPIPSFLAVALGALVVAPPTVPASGSQQSILTVDRPAMVHLSTVNPAGTSCQVIDHLRGPFASSGAEGSSNCDIDLLLDSGVYKVRLASPAKGKGNVAVKAEPFQEINSPLLRLAPGREIDGLLKPRQQASFWLHLDQRSYAPLRVSGRTAGLVQIWRNGEWLEETGATPQVVTPTPGRPIWEWWIGKTLEAGDYLVTVYGTNPQSWTRGPEENPFSVAWLWDPMPSERVVEATLPPWGTLAWALPAARPLANLELSSPPSSPVELSLIALPQGEGVPPQAGSEGNCRVEAKALRPTCTATGSSEVPHALLVRGAPGSRVRVEWARIEPSNPVTDGDYVAASTLEFKVPATATYLVALKDAPADPDGAPLGCILRRSTAAGWELVARDFLVLGPKHTIERSFNYNHDQALWFEISSSSTYALATSGARKSFCELYRLDADGSRTRLSETGTVPGCRLEKNLVPGAYELKLSGGNSGIETVTLADASRASPGAKARENAPSLKTGCLFPSASLEATPSDPRRREGLYRIETNRPALFARGLVVKRLPVAIDAPLSFELGAGRSIELPLAPGAALTVTGGGALACDGAASSTGSCKVPQLATPQTVILTNKATEAYPVTIQRPLTPPQLPPLQAWNPTFAPLPSLVLDTPVSFDFARNEEHSLVFEVKDAGLYHLSTNGLLATSCRIRTPATLSLASDSGGGPGRNCLVSSYLRPGRYLATVQTQGQSRGRAAVALSRRPSKAGPSVAEDGQAFFRVEAGTLVEEKLDVRSPGLAKLETVARGAQLSCRLEDAEGWPVLPVPSSCQLTHDFKAGEYLWVQLPLTVESMRRTLLEKIKPEGVLAGGTPHTIGYNTWYTAKLGKSGKDELLFDAETPLDVQLVLTGGMQGRLYAFRAGGALDPIEFIAPQQVATAPMSEESPPSTTEDAPHEDEQPPPPEGIPEEEASPPESPPETAFVTPLLPATPTRTKTSGPTGQSLHLEPGHYKLILEHSRDDVSVTYRLYLRSDVLAPGISRQVEVPGNATVRVPHEGVLRLRTEGETDVRCRLTDALGRIVAESSGLGDDWNCAIAEPVPAGDYVLSIESETLSSGATSVSAAMPIIESVASLADGSKLKLGALVVQAPLPDAAGDVIHEISLQATGGLLSCDLSGPAGVVSRRSNVSECSFLVRPRGARYLLRTWTLDETLSVNVHVAAKSVSASSRSKIPSGQAVVASIPRDGRYTTDRNVYCLADGAGGVLDRCGPDVSLDQGPWVFAALGPKDAELSLDEVIFSAPGTPAFEAVHLSHKPWLQTAKASKSSLHLVRISGHAGEHAAPSCLLSGGARVLRDTECYAASLAQQATLRAWSGDDDVETAITRFAITLPSDALSLTSGQQPLRWTEPSVRLALPPQPSRVELVLPAETWAVQLDGSNKAVDLCAPERELSRCVFAARGGEIVLWTEGERRAEATLVLGESTARAQLVAGLFEALPRIPGMLTIDVPAVAEPRRLDVEGAKECTVRFASGARARGCTAQLPANQSAELVVLHDGSGVRAIARKAESLLDGLFSSLGSGKAESLPFGRALPLGGDGVERTLAISSECVVHVHADAGVCGLVAAGHVVAAGGLGGGCEIHRLLEPGTYVLLARPFGRQALDGSVVWTQTAVDTLAEGIGPEKLLAPGQAQLFRFTLASAGRVGIGVQQTAETLECSVRDASQTRLGDGCQQLLKLEAGSYLLEIRVPQESRPMRFRPVVVGLSGAKMDAPEDYLRDFFNRIGGLP